MTSLRTSLLLIGLIVLSLSAASHNVTILPGGMTPALSGSYSRLSYDNIAAITSPQDGDIAYDITFKCMRLYNGLNWVRLVSDQDLKIPSMTRWGAGGNGTDEAFAIATDTSGNVYVTGYFRNTISFEDTSVTSSGGQDLFIVKYNNIGILQWLVTKDGTLDEIGFDIVLDSNGNIYITGDFIISSDFSGTVLTSVGDTTDAFTAKYSSNGSLMRVQQGEGSNVDASYSIAVDSTNNVYITVILILPPLLGFQI